MPITSQWLKIDLHCLQNIILHFWPKLTHPAARSLCDSWATCCVWWSIFAMSTMWAKTLADFVCRVNGPLMCLIRLSIMLDSMLETVFVWIVLQQLLPELLLQQWQIQRLSFLQTFKRKTIGNSYHWDSKLTRLRGDHSCVFPSRSEDNCQVLFLFPDSVDRPSKLCLDLPHTDYQAIDRNFCSVQYNTLSWFCCVTLRSKHAKNWQRITKS